MIDLSKLAWTKDKSFMSGGVRIQSWWVTSAGLQGVGLGVDPGKNFGLTLASASLLITYSATFPQSGVGVYWDWRAFISDMEFDLLCSYPAVIEGASYNDQFGQVGLAEIRYAIQLALHMSGFGVTVVPPQSIRKAVFGSAKIRGQDIWPTLNRNAADSVVIALYASGYRYDT